LTKSLAKLPVNPPDGIVKLVSFPLKATAEMHVALTQGFQNVPRLYGDDNIRRAGKVTGIASGLVEAAKGFTLGLGDAAMSVFEQPYLGAQKEGGVGFLKGAAKGIAGMYMKGGAGLTPVEMGRLMCSGVCCAGEDYAGGLDGVSETVVF
jgi:hypothetical protein